MSYSGLPNSKCCHARMTIGGRTTNYYVCTACGEPTGPEEVPEPPNEESA
jgi:hypothetical protein